MFKGITLALIACFIWGLIFVVPQFMGSFNSAEIAVGRYCFFGALSLLLFFKQRLRGFCRYPLSVWINAFFLSFLAGYYLWVVLAIRYASAEICALILGISPITIAFYGNWKQKEGNFKLLILPSILILVGLLMINIPRIAMTNSLLEYSIGLICAFLSLASWSIYVVLNCRYLKNNTHIRSDDWATIQGVTTLLWVAACGLGFSVFFWESLEIQKYFIWNTETISFYIGCGILGLLCSWVGATLWNKASVYLPVSLAGQLMIFETIFGIVFVYLLNLQLPSLLESFGIVLLLGAVIHGIRVLTPQPGCN
jgi:drug/metabolite transporter (DMT)-like permease